MPSPGPVAAVCLASALLAPGGLAPPVPGGPPGARAVAAPAAQDAQDAQHSQDAPGAPGAESPTSVSSQQAADGAPAADGTQPADSDPRDLPWRPGLMTWVLAAIAAAVSIRLGAWAARRRISRR